MSTPARALPESTTPLPSGLPVIINAKDVLLPTLPPSDQSLKFIDAQTAGTPATPQPKKKKEQGGAVLRGIKDLQQLQKQTIAVLESVKGTLDDIQQVLRSPEATRGMEKQQNAAMLLGKGFAREAVEQAQGAVSLLPANPDAHLLLSLSLAADQQFDASLAVARKGLALVDRRVHPLAIECGLLHALAALGCGAEAVDRWIAIVDALPLPVLFEQLARIAACFPTDACGGGPALLDDVVNRRISREEQALKQGQPARLGKIDTRPDELPAPAVFLALDAAKDASLACTHRAILAQLARRLQVVKNAPDVVKFLGECVVPLGNRGLDRSAGALGRAAVKRMLSYHADAMTLHRALIKLQMAGAAVAAADVARLLSHWRTAGRKVARAKRTLALASIMILSGAALLIATWAGQLGHTPLFQNNPSAIPNSVWYGPAILAAGCLLGLTAVFGRTWNVELPSARPPLTAEERAYIRTTAVRDSLQTAASRG